VELGEGGGGKRGAYVDQGHSARSD